MKVTLNIVLLAIFTLPSCLVTKASDFDLEAIQTCYSKMIESDKDSGSNLLSVHFDRVITTNSGKEYAMIFVKGSAGLFYKRDADYYPVAHCLIDITNVTKIEFLQFLQDGKIIIHLTEEYEERMLATERATQSISKLFFFKDGKFIYHDECIIKDGETDGKGTSRVVNSKSINFKKCSRY